MSTKFQLLIKTKIPRITAVSCFTSLRCGIYHANECLNPNNNWHFYIYERINFVLSWEEYEKKCFNLGARLRPDDAKCSVWSGRAIRFEHEIHSPEMTLVLWLAESHTRVARASLTLQETRSEHSKNQIHFFNKPLKWQSLQHFLT